VNEKDGDRTRSSAPLTREREREREGERERTRHGASSQHRCRWLDDADADGLQHLPEVEGIVGARQLLEPSHHASNQPTNQSINQSNASVDRQIRRIRALEHSSTYVEDERQTHDQHSCDREAEDHEHQGHARKHEQHQRSHEILPHTSSTSQLSSHWIDGWMDGSTYDEHVELVVAHGTEDAAQRHRHDQNAQYQRPQGRGVERRDDGNHRVDRHDDSQDLYAIDTSS